ncbi:lysosomal-associated transmembrane protein 4A [Trichonephila inaurata madagascariensis]|uniref:Lysosomal-associated transmembrane protein 4A n=1 Tax=Trichonephila inaurata madagascariensis TaxID=2747483 RepID=A0A8X6XAD8_9ARAC|nr:lysosomal-associated transmembrane protein 4A [Trichonephila inaurata madagascariensis]
MVFDSNEMVTNEMRKVCLFLLFCISIFKMYVKSDLGSGENFRCCICFHVRTGTIILGIWHLVLHLLALTLLVSVVIHPEARNRLTAWAAAGTATPHDVNGLIVSEYYSPQIPDISAGPAANYAFGHERHHQLKDVHVALAITVCTGVLTLFLLYGTIRGKPNYLMPFFSLQVFDFIISTLTAVGYFSSVPDVRRMLEEASDLPMQKELMHLNPEWLCAILMIAVVVCMLLKAYFMGVVWSCYKYLKLLHVAQMVESYIEADNEALLPPDYDTATKAPPHAAMYAPPPYAADFHGV